MRLCACGCNKKVNESNKWHYARYVRGHNMRGKNAYWSERPESTNTFTWHERARKLFARDACSIAHIGSCKGIIHLHHKDGNFMNNNRENVIPLCVSHHKLVELGRIDLSHPVMPVFYVDGGGKRRFKYARRNQ